MKLVKSQELKSMIDAVQIRAARGLLNLSQANLARMASVHVATIRRLEAATEVRGAAETLWKIQRALESAGIEFISAEAGKGPGVRLRQG
jgi:transcriptional regulator with XRE-family HTH domain